ncbi:hypothetical protein DL96DRAFT_1561247 [Flagelloscypha sp. PMI_526]|nr:hypothetical protein DL96DRAFT_1561247 [Flagelloscypha sp. PMI_526]
MVKEIINRVQADQELSSPPRVRDYFDMICGSGFEGLLAITCDILKMTGGELVQEFVNLCRAVFSESLEMNQRTAVLKQEIKRMIAKYSTEGEERRMFCENDTCKTSAFQNTGHPRLFRNYNVRANPSLDCMLWEAAYATTAMPELFSPIIIGDTHSGETFVAGDLRWNNPTDELTKEAALVFARQRISSIISIGSGHPGHMSLSKGLADLFSCIALDCERVADDMERRFGKTPEVFWRLNVERECSDDTKHRHAPSGPRSTTQTNPRRRNIWSWTRCIGVFRPKVCPPPTQYFTGRQADLKKLEEYFSLNRESASCRIGVLYGIGGGGKSQMGLEFIRRSQVQRRFTDVFFVDASNKVTLENDLKTIAIGASDKPTVDDAYHVLRTAEQEWLLFLDNADDPSLNLRPYIMWSHGNVLITTRNREAREHAPDCNICKLGCLALAVNQALGFLAQDICTLGEYLPIYLPNRKKLLEGRLIQTTDDYKHTIYTTWTMRFSKLSPPAAYLLSSYALCIMIPFLLASLSCWVKRDLLRFRLLVKELLAFSLVDFNISNHAFSLHPLIQHWAQSQCEPSQDIISSTQTLLPLAVPGGKSKEDIVVTLSLLPHVRASTQTGFDVHFTLLHNFGLTYHRSAMLPECAVVYEQEHLKRVNEYGTEHPFTLRSVNNFASTYSDLGLHRVALKLQEQALVLSKQTLGKDHLFTLAVMSNRGCTYSGLGRHTDALKLEEHVLALRTQILGEEHPYSLFSMNSLASIYADLGRHRDALKLEERVLALSTQINGKDHPYTLTSMRNLAITYSALGQHSDAMNLKEQVVDFMNQTLGTGYPHALATISSLAGTLSGLGQHIDALELHEQTLSLRSMILGPEHPDTIDSFNRAQSLQHRIASEKGKRK